MRTRLRAADLYCGAGGSSKGLMDACKAGDVDMDLIAINHWDIAIKTHSKNHPGAKHLCTSLDSVDPKVLVPGGRLDILIASPECIHFSIARGGRPMNDQSRSSAWQILRWAEALYIENILIENVREFLDWCPLGADGRPLKSKKGQTFKAFIAALRSLGYRVEWKILNAANYGDPTTRERLFIMAKRGNKRISWPTPTHAPNAKPTLFAQKPWRTAREIIDWSVPGTSIFTRKKPLAAATLARIAAGLKKFGGKNAEPFLVILRNHMSAQSIDAPVPALTASGQHMAVCQPFVLGQQSCSAPRSVDEPLPTVATGGAISLIQPFLVGAGGPVYSGKPKSVDEPMNTVLTENHIGVVEPFLMTMEHGGKLLSQNDPMPTITSADGFGVVEPFIVTTREGAASRCGSLDDPLPTVTGSKVHALVESFIIPTNHGKADTRSHSLDNPMPTVTSVDAWGVIEPFIAELRNGKTANSIDEPLSTVTTKGAHHAIVEPFLLPHRVKDGVDCIDNPMRTVTATSSDFALVEPFIASYYGTDNLAPIDVPLPTVTTKDRFGLIEVDGMRLDIRFRMLQPRELARAQGFPDDYEFAGNREQVVKQIGNAVPRRLARALCAEMLGFTEALERSA